MADSPKTVSITAEIPEDLYNALLELANKRGVSANTVLSQAINTEKYLADSEAAGAKVLVERRDRKFERLVPKTRGAG
jgi:predicted transcriptional regulator